jgi:perosamine synthetase
MIPYGRQSIDEDDIRAVVDVLRSDWLTTGPKVAEFEQFFAQFAGAKEAVAVNSGTAALHAAMYALKIEPGDEVIVPAITFAATANCVVFQGGTPVFVDVNPDTLLIEPEQVESKINSRTRAVIAMDYAGQPADYDRLRAITDKNGIALVADACHSLGAKYKDRKVGTLADLNIFSFHPVKHITTGEGGMIATDNSEFASRMRIFRNHGITTDYHQREATGSWYYEMVDLGFNYRITDIQCALGLSQLKKLPDFLAKRREIAKRYNQKFSNRQDIKPLKVEQNVSHAFHLYVIAIEFDAIGKNRQQVFKLLRDSGIGVNVHYIPVHLHPYYKKRFESGPGNCPVAELMYEKILSLPIYPNMKAAQVDEVVEKIFRVIELP